MIDERGSTKDRSCGSIEGGFTVFMDRERIRAFMEARDFSSAAELEHFGGISAHIQQKVRDKGGASFLALSMGEASQERDFAVLQIAHSLARSGVKVLIVDCDFLHPGLSGLVEDLEQHGFLDLLLYGSSLRTVAKSVGIEGVSIVGPGSFPVSRTIPFALKEFTKIRDFLRAKHDAVIYCSTLETEDRRLNPLISLVDGVLAICRIDEMADGELEQRISAISSEKASSVEVLCFCAEKERVQAPRRAREAPEEVTIGPSAKVAQEKESDVITLPMDEAPEAETQEREKKPSRGIKFQRVGIFVGAAIIVAFVAWWVAVHRTVERTIPSKPVETVEKGEVGGGTPSVTPSSTDETGQATTSPSVAHSEESGVTGTPASGTPAEGTSSGVSPESAPQAETREPLAGPPKYTVHVASFTENFRAEAEKDFLEKNGFEVRIVEVPIKDKIWLRVFVGPYATREEADKARLEVLGLKGHPYARVVEIEKMAK